MRNTCLKQSNFESSKVLRFFFEQKKKSQPNYSLRALSRDLGMSQSYVSEVFSGKKIPSADKISNLVRALGMDAIGKKHYEESFFNDLFPNSEAKPPTTSWKATGSADGSLLRKWYYLVILDFVDCKGFRSDPDWIARRLGIKTSQATEAIEWLAQNKYLHLKNGQLLRTQKKIFFSTAKSLPDFRAYHKQMIELAALELSQKKDRASFERRLISGISFTCNPRKLEQAKKKLLSAIYAVADDLMEGECTEVYQINLQLFPHTTPHTDR
jgi:uncharacterized protein (TIGR02147 family)